MPNGCEVQNCTALYWKGVSPLELTTGMQSTAGVRPDPGLGHPEYPSCDHARRLERRIKYDLTLGETFPAGLDLQGAIGVTFGRKPSHLNTAAFPRRAA